MWSFFSRDPAKAFPFEVGEKISGLEPDQCIWSLHEGKQKSNGQPVSVFMFDVTSNSETVKQIAQASVKRLKTLRHPNVLSFMDSLETDKCIYVVTEPVKPLKLHMEEQEKDSKSKDAAVSWGLHQIVKGLSFLLNTVNLIHNNVCMSSMFVDAAGEWKLGGIDYMYPASGQGSNIPPIKTLPALEKYDPPEKSGSSGRSKKTAKWSSDMWGLGCLIWETFNGNLPRTSSLKVIGKIPKSLVRNYCELVSANPAARPSPDKFLENCKLPDAFMNNHFVQTNIFLEEIQIKEPHEQTAFFTDLTNHLDEFPPLYSKHKILPQLLNVFQFGSCGPSVLPPLFKLGKLLDTVEYQAQIVPCVVKLFSSTDRATRIHLLRQIPLFVEHLQPAVVNSQVFPNMITGFMDTNPAIREQSVKGMLLLAPKLNDNNLNNELMKHFARLQSRDDQGPIRTNTTVCLGKLIPFLNPPTRHKVISSAFARAMKDPFPAARIAGILAMCNTVEYFSTTDSATKALPALCAATIDPDKQVRQNAFKTIKAFLDKLQTASDNPEEAEKMNQAAASSPPNMSSAAGWTGWMTTGVSSITSKLYTNKSNPTASREASSAASATPSVQDSVKASPDETLSKPLKSLSVKEKSEPTTDNGWKNNDDWDDFEDIERTPVNTYKPKKIITTGQLRAMEEDIWHDLDSPTKKTASAEEENENSTYDAWDNSGWDDEGLEEQVTQDAVKEDNLWGGGWEADDDWADDRQTSVSTSNFTSTDADQPDLKPSSTYNWTKDAKDTEESFFNDFAPKPKKEALENYKENLEIVFENKENNFIKTLIQKSRTTKQAASKTTRQAPKSAPAPKPVQDSWGGDDWGDSGWGDNADEGMSKAEKLKLEREEKKRLRQKQLQEKRAAKGSAKLGARKCD